MSRKEQKSIGYAYPTSTNAKKAGFVKTGYYIVELGIGYKLRNAGTPRLTKEEAIKDAEALPNTWSPIYTDNYDVNDKHRPRTYEEKKALNLITILK